MSQNHRQRAASYARWWSWPPPIERPPEEWSGLATMGYIACPRILGVGPNEREIADEEWIAGMLDAVDQFGPLAFWTGFTDLLRHTYREFYDLDRDYLPIANYPEIDVPFEIPMANVAIAPGDYHFRVDGKWSPEMIRGMRHNPVFVGIPPFPMIISQGAWCENISADDQDDTMLQRFVNVLYCLRRTYGCAATPYRPTPLGYERDSRTGLFKPAGLER